MSDKSTQVDQSGTYGYRDDGQSVHPTAYQKPAVELHALKSCLCACNNCINARELNKAGELNNGLPQYSQTSKNELWQVHKNTIGHIYISNIKEQERVAKLVGDYDIIDQQDNRPWKTNLKRPIFRFRRPSDEAIDIAAIFSSN